MQASEEADPVQPGRSWNEELSFQRRWIQQIVGSFESPIVRIYSRIRFSILRQVFLEEIDQYLPKRGRILDLGCGFGLFSLFFAGTGPQRRISGVDLDAGRIKMAQACAKRLGLRNVEYSVGDAVEWDASERFDAIYLLDMIHHLPQAEAPAFLKKLRDRLERDGVLVIKEVEDRPRWKMLFTLALDRLMVGMEPIHYWAQAELIPVLEGMGFHVVRHRMRDFLPYPHVLYICHLKPSDTE